MPDVWRDNGGNAGSSDLRHAIDRHFQLAFDDLPHRFLRMKMLVDGRALAEVVMRERHVRRMKIPPIPSRLPLNHLQRVRIDKRHGARSARAIYHSDGTRSG